MKVFYFDMKAAKAGYISEAELTDEEYAALATPKGRRKPLKINGKIIDPKSWDYSYESCAHAILLRLRNARDDAHKKSMSAQAKHLAWENRLIHTKAYFQKNGIINNL